MPIKNMTPEQIAEATRAQVTAGVKSTTKAAKLNGETQSEANARLTAAYKELVAKPVLSKEQIEGGMKVQYVRTQAGGFGEYVAIKPPGYTGPTKIKQFTDGVMPEGSKYYTGERVGLDTGNRTADEYRKVLVGKLTAGNKLTDKERAWLDANPGDLNPNVTKVSSTSSTTETSNKGLETKNGILYNNGIPFNGKGPDGKTYTNGIPDDTEDKTLTSNNNNPSPNATLVSTETDAYGNTVGIFSDGTTKIVLASGNKYKSTVDEDAYGILEKTFKDFGLEDLVPEIKKYMEVGLGSEQAGLELRKTNAYLTRFKGNEVRRAAGLNVLSEDAYLELENSYNETLRRFGLQGYFGTDRKVATATMASIIGNDISAVEFKDRIDTVVTRVNNADANIKTTLRAFYNITDSDLVKYFLNPKENLPKLQEKVTAAEIGSEFIKQGLVTGVLSAEEFAKLGIDKQAAAKGAETIAAILPETKKLGSIYDEEAIDYTQKTAEEEVLKGLDSARRKRLRLAEKEVGSFSGSAGLARGALTNNRSSAF